MIQLTRGRISPPARMAAFGAAVVAAGAIAGIAVASNTEAQTPPHVSVAALDDAGQPTTVPDSVRRSLEEGAASEYGPDVASARSVTSPDGDTWTIVPTVADGACLVADEALTCGPASAIASGEYGLTLIAAPTGEAARAEARAFKAARERALASGDTAISMPNGTYRGLARRLGIVPDGITEVRALDDSGQILHEANVRGNVYELPLAREGDAALFEMLGADGTVIASYRLWR